VRPINDFITHKLGKLWQARSIICLISEFPFPRPWAADTLIIYWAEFVYLPYSPWASLTSTTLPSQRFIHLPIAALFTNPTEKTSSSPPKPQDTQDTHAFTLYDLRISVEIPPRSQDPLHRDVYCGARDGDFFELRGEILHLPSPDRGFSTGSATIRDIAYRYGIAAKSISYRRIDTNIDSA
jgi:hypothetical protein